MAQQTAVDWLKNMIEWNYGNPKMLEITWENLDDLIERAKAMEKEHLEDCWIAAEQSKDSQTFFNYYNETYNK